MVTIIPPAHPPSCQGYRYPIQAGGDVYVGESCLNVSAGISSGQVISWYKNGMNTGNDIPDARRIVQDAQNFYVNPDDFLVFGGIWYVGTTDQVAFVVRNVTSDILPGSSTQNMNVKMIVMNSSGDYGKFDVGVWAIINSTNKIDYSRVWVVLEESPGILGEPGTNLTLAEMAVFREQQRDYYLEYTKPVVDYVRGEGYTVDYIGQTSPSIEVLAPPPFMEELAQRPEVRKIVATKASHKLIKEMLQRQPDEILKVTVSHTKPPRVIRMPSGSFTEEQLNEYYSANRLLFENYTRPIIDLLENENVNIHYAGPYPATGFRADVPVHLIEEFNARPEVASMDREIRAYII
ncbi:MAG: DUF3821 domain-containing protein [Methanomicrobiales archaeon]